MPHALDLVFRQAAVAGWDGPVDVGVQAGRIVAMGPRLQADAPEVDVAGRVALPGFVDTHVHLDKACLLGRCGHVQGGLAGAIRAVSDLKRGFTGADVYARGARVLEKAIVKDRKSVV